MTTLAAPVQSDRSAWHGTRVGRFTASTIGALMTPPRSKSKTWSDTALTLIATKAVERLMGQPVQTAANFSMKRGTLLEHAATYLLSQHWQPVDACTWMPIGDNSGATPDGLLRDGSPVDIKCPDSPVTLLEFGDAVADGDWLALLDWDRTYAWQIATQALAAGSERASLVYFSDRLPWLRWQDEERDTCNAIMSAEAAKLFNLTSQVYDYHIPPTCEGWAYVARSFEIPQEAFDQLEDVLRRAEAECLTLVERYAAILPER